MVVFFILQEIGCKFNGFSLELQEIKTIYEKELENLQKFATNASDEHNFSFFKRKKLEKFERLEKARFFLDQEQQELDKLIGKINEGRDEIEDCLRNEKRIMKKAGVSATKQVLLAILKGLRPSKVDFEGFLLNFIGF